MRKIYCTKCKKYKELKKSKILYICDELIFKEKVESIDILEIHSLITNIEGYQKTYNHV